MLYYSHKITTLFIFLLFLSFAVQSEEIRLEQQQYQVPVLINKENNPIIRIKVVSQQEGMTLSQLRFSTNGTTDVNNIKVARIYAYGTDSLPGKMEDIEPQLFAMTADVGQDIVLEGKQTLKKGDNFFWLSYELQEDTDLSSRIVAQLQDARIDNEDIQADQPHVAIQQRVGMAVRKHKQDSVHTSRIPGLATTNNGTLIAVFDARYDSGRDLQGHMDIGIHRSEDGGESWEPIQIVLDKGAWGGLPEKFNGVSDAGILVDRQSGTIYIAGLWMHGLLDEQGNWIENLTEESDQWDHQWRNKASQPGYDVRQTSQFLIVKSTDDGKTWSEPINITAQGKQKDWWLWAPAPGQGITLQDGTLVFPTQGRDEHGFPFSNITYSKDGGETWVSTNPAVKESTTECTVVELSDGSIMLNMRADDNRGDTTATNGRAVAVTNDLGLTWAVHPTSHHALPEPVCMASMLRHAYNDHSFLLFSNPNSKTKRHHLSIKISDDDGMHWDGYSPLLLDEWSGRGYSCLTSVDNDYIGILYESSQADMVFQKVAIADLIQQSNNN